MTTRSLVRSLVRPVVRGVVRNVPGSVPYVAVERIPTGHLDEADGWVGGDGSPWLIGAGVAEVVVIGALFPPTFDAAVAAGREVTWSIDTNDIDEFRLTVVALVDGAGAPVDTLYMGLINGAPSIGGTYTASGSFNSLRITSVGAGSVGCTIDNVSLIA